MSLLPGCKTGNSFSKYGNEAAERQIISTKSDSREPRGGGHKVTEQRGVWERFEVCGVSQLPVVALDADVNLI